MKTIVRILILAAVVAMVIYGGYLERGYFAPAAESILIPLGIGWIAYMGKEDGNDHDRRRRV